MWDYENNLRQLIGQATRTGPVFVAGDDWRQLDGGLIALASTPTICVGSSTSIRTSRRTWRSLLYSSTQVDGCLESTAPTR